LKKIILLITLFVQILFGSIESVTEIAEHDTFRVIVPLGNNKASTGTGFIINKDGYLITNNHVVKGGSGKIFVKNNFDEYKDVSLIKTYPKHDIAILKINNYKKTTFLKLQNPSTIKKGLQVYPLGFPGGADLLEGLTFNASLSAGIISKIDITTEGKFPPNYKFIQIDAAINHGNSGGPLLSKNGTVLGINTLGRKGTQGIYWAIHVEELIKVRDENSIDYIIDNDNIGDTNNMKSLWIVLALFGVLVLGILIFISKKKNPVAEIDEREVSRLVKEKIQKHDNRNANGVVSDELKVNENVESLGKTHMMSVTLVSKNTMFPEINNLNKQEIILGRSDISDIVINNASVSKQHLKLLMRGSLVEVIDLGSTNGTYIDAKKLTPNQSYTLELGQKLTIGSEDVIYMIKDLNNKLSSKTLLSSIDKKYPNICEEGIIGRNDKCDTVIANSKVSSKHLKVSVVYDTALTPQKHIYITDLGSTNGTYIEGKKLRVNESIELKAKQTLIIGSEEVVYQLADG